MSKKYDTIIVGGGQAGLSTSYYLKQKGCEHVVLEQADKAGNAWRNDRWDSFTLLTPRWAFRIPGAEYHGDEPNGFMLKDEIVTRFEDLVGNLQLPIEFQVRVNSVEHNSLGTGYFVYTDETSMQAQNVVIATGFYQSPRIPSFASDIPAHILQLPSGQYRNPQSLPAGAVLVVGSAQSGTQITEELYQSGRKVYLSTGVSGRAPRRYRGKDIFEWMLLSGFFDQTVDQLPSPKDKFSASVHVSGRDGGHNLNLHQFARDGVVLLGHIKGTNNGKIWFTPDLKENLSRVDQSEANLIRKIDSYIEHEGLNIPVEILPDLRDGFDAEEITELDLGKAGITSIVWAIGYRSDFSMMKLPVVDEDGYPIQERGISQFPGLYFIGMPWLFKPKSSLLIGVGEDAEYITSKIGSGVSS